MVVGGGKERGWKYGAGAGLKSEGWHFSYLSFSKLCYAFEGKNVFSVTIILGKKVILSCLKMSLKISHKLR